MYKTLDIRQQKTVISEETGGPHTCLGSPLSNEKGATTRGDKQKTNSKMTGSTLTNQ